MTESRIQHMAAARHKHARDCRRPIDSCSACKDNIAWFAALPLNVLSDVLAEHSNAFAWQTRERTA